jgi:hypothetical protein
LAQSQLLIDSGAVYSTEVVEFVEFIEKPFPRPIHPLDAHPLSDRIGSESSSFALVAGR